MDEAKPGEAEDQRLIELVTLVVEHGKMGGRHRLDQIRDRLARDPHLLHQNVVGSIEKGLTLMSFACVSGYANVLRLLLGAGARPEPANMWQALVHADDARTRMGRQACALMLVESGVDVHAPLDIIGRTALFYAVEVSLVS